MFPLFGLAAAVVGCGGRTLDADGFNGGGGAGSLGPSNGDNGNGDNGNGDNGNGNNGNGDNGNGDNGNGNNGNGNNGNGNNGNGNNSGTSAGTGGSSSAQAVSATVSSSDGSTTGSAVPGSCRAPHDLNDFGGTYSGVTSYFSAFIGECNGAGPELFFTWEAPRSAGYRLHTTGSSIDTVLYRLDRNPCDGRVVACNDDAHGSPASELLFSADRGQRMTFVLDSFYAAGSVELTIEEIDLPPCGPAYAELSGLGQLVNQALPLDETTLGDPMTDTCEGKAPRIRFDWTAPHDGDFTFDTAGSNYDTVLVVRTICDILAGERCNDDQFDLQSGVIQSASEGQVLRIEIAAFDGNATPSNGGAPIVVLNVR